jgi:hypothetical protein
MFLLSAVNVASSRLAELQPSSLEPTTNALLQQARQNAQQEQTLLKALQDAVNAKANDLDDDQSLTANLLLAMNALSVVNLSSTSLNRSIEQLMLQYNISDSEVGYLFRGK